jgi:hypothetical protein
MPTFMASALTARAQPSQGVGFAMSPHLQYKRRMHRVLASLSIGSLLFCATVRADPPAPGAVLDASNAATASELLPPEVIARYQAGEYRNTVAAWSTSPAFSPKFLEATAQNQAKLAASERGTILTGPGGARATGIYGLPFRIDASDPQAGVKAIWNAYYSLWRVGSTEDLLALDWIARASLERQAVLEARTLYYEGVPSGLAPKQNPLDLAAQQSAVVHHAGRSERHRVARLALSRSGQGGRGLDVRPGAPPRPQISPTNRSDGFLGSDLSQDDGSFFDGKPESFEWKLLGEREGFVLADPASLSGSVKRSALPKGGYAEEWAPAQTVVGYQDKSWTGRRLGAGRTGAGAPQALGGRGAVARSLLSLPAHRDRARPGDVPGRVEPQVRRAGHAAAEPPVPRLCRGADAGRRSDAGLVDGLHPGREREEQSRHGHRDRAARTVATLPARSARSGAVRAGSARRREVSYSPASCR